MSYLRRVVQKRIAPKLRSFCAPCATFCVLLGDRCKTVRLLLSDRCNVSLSVCPVCLSVTLVYRGQTVGWIKVKLGVQVGLVPGYIVLDGTHLLLQRGTAPQFSAHICCGQTAGWIKMPLGMAVSFGPGDFVLDWDQASPPQKRAEPPSKFSAHVYCGQMAGWIKMPFGLKVALDPCGIVLDRDPAPSSHRKGHSSTPPSFRPMSIVATVAHLCYC